MFVSGDFWDKSPERIFEKFEIALILVGQFRNFQNCARAIYSKSPSQACDY